MPFTHFLPPPSCQVVGTIGPSSQSVEVLCQLLESGMSAARFDLTWGPMEYHRRSLDNLQVRVGVRVGGQ